MNVIIAALEVSMSVSRMCWPSSVCSTKGGAVSPTLMLVISWAIFSPQPLLSTVCGCWMHRESHAATRPDATFVSERSCPVAACIGVCYVRTRDDVAPVVGSPRFVANELAGKGTAMPIYEYHCLVCNRNFEKLVMS